LRQSVAQCRLAGVPDMAPLIGICQPEKGGFCEGTSKQLTADRETSSAQLRAGDYYGPVVSRSARIRGLGHGGQVLLSAAAAALVRDALPAGAYQMLLPTSRPSSASATA
jgi:hypothetical protein